MDIDIRPAIDGEEIYIPQHPGGRAKEFGLIDTNEAGNKCRVLNSNSGCCGCSGYKDVRYTCDTQGGSSGSPVLARSSHRVIALHHCGGACNGNMGVPVSEFPAAAINLIYPNGIPDFEDPNQPKDDDSCDHQVTIKILTDRYGEETSWSLKDSNGNTLATQAVWLNSGGVGYLSDFTAYEHKLCVPEGTLTFDIRDSWGDGCCCKYGKGKYEIEYDGELVHSGGEFDYFEEVQVPPAPCKPFKLVLRTDNYPSETSWKVIDSKGVVAIQGGGYNSKMTNYVATACLASDQSYQFIMYDSYGDGICCGYGYGTYRLTFDGEVLVSSGGRFSDEEIIALA